MNASPDDPEPTGELDVELDDALDEASDVIDSTDEGDPADDTAIEPTSRPVRFARHTATGAVLNGIALGLAEVLEPEREEAPIIQVLPGEPPEPGWVDTDIDPLEPAASQVTVRPWLDDSSGGETTPESD